MTPNAESVRGWNLLLAALSDPTIALVEKEEHAADYWRRQAERVMALLDSDAWAQAEDDWIMGRTPTHNDGGRDEH